MLILRTQNPYAAMRDSQSSSQFIKRSIIKITITTSKLHEAQYIAVTQTQYRQTDIYKQTEVECARSASEGGHGVLAVHNAIAVGCIYRHCELLAFCPQYARKVINACIIRVAASLGARGILWTRYNNSSVGQRSPAKVDLTRQTEARV